MSKEYSPTTNTEANILSERPDVLTQMRSFPQDIPVVAEKYAHYLQILEIEKPLNSFLTDVSLINGLDGVGLTVWEEEKQPPMLAVYVLSDAKIEDLPNIPAPDSLAAESYATCFKQINQFKKEHRLRMTMWVVNSAGTYLDDFLTNYPDKLKDLILGEHRLGEIKLPADLAILRPTSTM